jgi:hypothetical protein
MTVVNRLFGENPGGSGPAKELPHLGAPSADLDKAVTGATIAPSGCRPHTDSALAHFAQLTGTRG